MKSNKLVIQINTPAEDVYNFYIDPKNTPLWINSIVSEQTNEWPIKIGTIYKNQNKEGAWTEYKVSRLKQNELFELTTKDGNYHVRYTHRPINDKTTELEYYEWVDHGKISEPFTQGTLQKLKEVVEARA